MVKSDNNTIGGVAHKLPLLFILIFCLLYASRLKFGIVETLYYNREVTY